MEKLISSEAKVLVLTLFHNNPGLIDNIEGVALRIGRSTAEIESSIRDLVELGVLVRKRAGKNEIISFDQTRDDEIQRAIANQLLRRDLR
jgi:predicted transcriptional regulator